MFSVVTYGQVDRDQDIPENSIQVEQKTTKEIKDRASHRRHFGNKKERNLMKRRIVKRVVDSHQGRPPPLIPLSPPRLAAPLSRIRALPSVRTPLDDLFPPFPMMKRTRLP